MAQTCSVLSLCPNILRSMRLGKKIILAFLFGSVAMVAQANPDIVRAFSNGDMQQISSFLDSSVDLTIQNNGGTKSRGQAQDAIASFFRNHRPSNFSVTHKTEKEKSGLMMGMLYTSSGNFQVLILTKKDGFKEIIHQLKIEGK